MRLRSEDSLLATVVPEEPLEPRFPRRRSSQEHFKVLSQLFAVVAAAPGFASPPPICEMQDFDLAS
jgi:hypothetical protein